MTMNREIVTIVGSFLFVCLLLYVFTCHVL